MNSKTRKQLLSFAAATGVLFQLGGTAHAVQVFDLGEFVVKAPASAATVETPEVAVTPATVEGAYTGGQVANSNLMGVLGRQSFIETPFNVTGYTNELLENKQATEITDVVKNDASVKDVSLSGASSSWSIRGFRTTQQDMQFNGLYSIAPRFYTGTEGYDRVEVIKGPSALLGGMAPNGTVGGTINFVPKRATDKAINKVKLSYGNGSEFTQHVDVGHRFGDNNKYGVRLNVLNRNGGTSVKDEERQTSSVVIGADVRGDKFRAALDLGYVYHATLNPQYRVLFNNGSLKNTTKENPFTPVHIDNDMKYGATDTFRRVTEKYGVVRGEYDLNKDWTAYAGIGARYTSMDYKYNEFTVTNLAKGDANIRYRHNYQINKGISAEAGLRGKVVTGDVTHHIGLAATRLEQKVYTQNNTLNTVSGFNYLKQATNWGTATETSWESPLSSKQILTGVSLTDRIVTKDEAWQFILGARYQKVRSTNYGAKETTYNSHAVSPAVGIVHKFNDKVSVYANYMEGLKTGVSAPAGTKNENELMAPVKVKQMEVGTKVDMGKYAATLSAFEVRNPSYTTDVATNEYGLNSEVRARGLELNVFGEPVKGTRVLGGLMWLDSKYTKDTSSTKLKGNKFEGAPTVNATLGVDQDIKGVKGLSVSTRLNYTGSAYANNTNTVKTSGYFTWDLGTRYTWNAGNTPMTFRADVYNVLNKSYWNALHSNGVMLGNGRTFMFSLTASL